MALAFERCQTSTVLVRIWSFRVLVPAVRQTFTSWGKQWQIGRDCQIYRALKRCLAAAVSGM